MTVDGNHIRCLDPLGILSAALSYEHVIVGARL
jgi:hypothetical protein